MSDQPAPPVTRCKPGRIRTTLRFDYKQPLPPSKTFSHATPFSRVKAGAQFADDDHRYEDAAETLGFRGPGRFTRRVESGVAKHAAGEFENHLARASDGSTAEREGVAL